MGAPKQKWTPEEEAALRAGIQKYGVGKWSVILKDPEFNAILCSRSNVDLKDKWRNMNCMVNGLSSRNRASSASKNSLLVPKLEEGTSSDSVVVEKDTVALHATPRPATNETIQDASSRNQVPRINSTIPRLDDLIMEAITKLKEPRGSSRHTIATYIEDRHSAPPDLEKNLAASLKLLTEKGQLVKVKHQYRIAPSSISSGVGGDPSLLIADGAKKDLSELQIKGIVILTKAEVDAELEKMKSMTPQEAAIAAAQAVKEAEEALAAAEAAAKEAEEAEVEAEAARCFANAAQKSCNFKFIRSW